MITTEKFRQMALSFQGTEESPHFNRAAFKVSGKRIFATLHEESKTANIILSLADQETFSAEYKNAVYPVPNKFGLQGWTTFELQRVPVEVLSEALFTAYNDVVKLKPRK